MMLTNDLKVLAGSPCGKTPVFDQFYDAFSALAMPEGSIKHRMNGGSVPENLNALVELAQNENCSHIFIVEDDSSFAPDSLIRLLMHDKPVVAGLCRSRQAPFLPYIYSGVDENGLIWRPLTKDDSGLIKVGATGMGGILIRMDVFDKLAKPYFKHYYIDRVPWGQDVIFGKSLIEAGIDVWCDLDVIIWHATQCVLGSEKIGDQWKTVITINKSTIKING